MVVFCRHELAIQALQTGEQDDAKPLVTEKEKESEQNLVIENQMVELGFTQQVLNDTFISLNCSLELVIKKILCSRYLMSL